MGGTYRSIRLSVREPPTTRWFCQKSTIGGRFRPTAVEFGRRQPIEEEIDRQRSISTVDSRLKKKSTVSSRLREKSTVDDRLREKSTIDDRLRKKKGRRRGKRKEKKEYLARAPSLPTCRRSQWVACVPSPPAGRPRPRPLFLPREETERLPALSRSKCKQGV
ncbi:hypothetical protein BHE74_00053266 [Ensete ventricosum]|nr:hypothetical protein BHE74_00053266 [Ensete ventricosum]